MNTNTAYISAGSNLGDRAATLRGALRALGETPGVRVAAVSSLYETDPVGGVPQPLFLNLAARLEITPAPAPAPASTSALVSASVSTPAPAPTSALMPAPTFVSAPTSTFAPALTLTPEALLVEMQRIERAFGRRRENEIHWGPRTLDLDLLLFGGETRATDFLTLPHPRLWERAFVLIPLREVVEISDVAPLCAKLEKFPASDPTVRLFST